MNIIITGAGKGIGLEAVKDLSLNPDFKIIAISRSINQLIALNRPNILPLAFDIVNDNYDELLAFVESKFDYISMLINNAGILINKPFDKLLDTDIKAIYETNIFAPFRLIRIFLPLLSVKPSHIVNISSMGAVQGSSKFPGLSAYSSSKAALLNLTECLAEEFKDKKIRVNCLALGAVQTDMLEQAFPGYKAELSAKDIGELISKFAMVGSKFYNGKVLPVALSTP